ncbi:MAG: PulJ/GspJ family protein [Armatimonadota bacterium]
MRPTSLPNRERSGFTLVELLIAGTVSALVLSCVCAIYFSVATGWERQQGEADALSSTSRSCARLGDYVSQAMGALAYTRFTTNDTLVLNMPLDKAYGAYIPIWTGGKVQTRSGQWLAFYLSDTTGRFSNQGDILWAGVVDWSTSSVTPDSAWSLYSSGGPGKITPLRSLRFDITTGDGLTRVKVTTGAAYKILTTEKGLLQTGTFCLRN